MKTTVYILFFLTIFSCSGKKKITKIEERNNIEVFDSIAINRVIERLVNENLKLTLQKVEIKDTSGNQKIQTHIEITNQKQTKEIEQSIEQKQTFLIEENKNTQEVILEKKKPLKLWFLISISLIIFIYILLKKLNTRV